MTFFELKRAIAAVDAENARADAMRLFAHFGGYSAAQALMDPELSGEEFLSAVARRLAGEPLAYILGEAPFFRESYRVHPSCLIPRKDSEIFVEYAIRHLPQGASFLDLCTGTGCLTVSILASRPDCFGIGVDIVPEAVALARENAERNGVATRCEFLLQDVFAPFPRRERFDMILSNPPYIPTKDLPSLSREVQHEPRIALDGGADGMCFYRHILPAYFPYLKADGFFLFETGYDQRENILALAEAADAACELFTDYEGNHRGARITRRTSNA